MYSGKGLLLMTANEQPLYTEETSPKKIYRTPELTEWGSIAEVTQGSGGGGQDDGTQGTEVF
jgi:hypothetical protein